MAAIKAGSGVAVNIISLDLIERRFDSCLPEHKSMEKQKCANCNKPYELDKYIAWCNECGDEMEEDWAEFALKKMIEKKICSKCGKKLKLVKGETHSYHCSCSPGTFISIG